VFGSRTAAVPTIIPTVATPTAIWGFVRPCSRSDSGTQRFRADVVADGRDQIAQVLERSVRRGDLTDVSAAADLQAVLIGAALMFPLFQPDQDEGALRDKITDLAMAVLEQRRNPPGPVGLGPAGHA